MIIELLSRTSKVDKEKLVRLSQTASARYKVYTIPKRAGGERIIEHPSQELKAVQRWIVRIMFSRFPVHKVATAYRKGTGIRENAERHRRTKYTNRYDFANFFPSFTQGRVEDFLAIESRKLDMVLTEQDIRFVGNIVCRHGHLTIGAPSSPAITNCMMFEFDSRFHDYCNNRELVFTRYADDVFVSANSPNSLRGIERAILAAKRNIPHLSIRLNRQKTATLSRKYNRTVAGVVITPDHKLSIGRDRKREIRSLIHKWISGSLDPERVLYLRGLVAFGIDVEPSLKMRLMTKYGAKAIDDLLHNPDLPVSGPLPI